jgi:hypothetical protein
MLRFDRENAEVYFAPSIRPALVIPTRPTRVSTFCQWLWEIRTELPFTLYRISELVDLFRQKETFPSGPKKDWRSRMGRELRKVGFRQVPEGKRATRIVRKRRVTESEIWFMDDDVLPHLKTVGDVIREYDSERRDGPMKRLKLELWRLKRRVRELNKELNFNTGRIKCTEKEIEQEKARIVREIAREAALGTP